MPASDVARQSAAWNARWVWPRRHASRPWNSYAYFRKVIDLPERPPRAVVRVSADARYTLYVNGRRVHHGPARSFPQTQSYDTLDLAPALQAGKNAIGVIVHQFGLSTFSNQFRDASGFLLDGVIDTANGALPLHTSAEWLCREAKAWRKETARLSIQLGFQEHFDADADPADWLSPAYKPDDT